ncbi:MAG: flavodoxin family protein [Desulfovibrionaceae bacterium]|nr:flavodoxin family protein [Desulfovibrionaceae bacterium]
MTSDAAAIFSCSHRAQGNSNAAARLFLRGVEEAGGRGHLIPVRNFKVLPCRACRICEKDPKSVCVQKDKDYAHELFEILKTAPVVFFASPIYFYHLPSMFKTLIDRSQSVYAARQKGDPEIVSLPERAAHACLLAGRARGERLFDGALLTLKYFLQSFNLSLAEPMTMRAVERIGDLEENQEACARIIALGRAAWEAAR